MENNQSGATAKVRLSIDAGPGTDREEGAELGQQLRHELLRSDLESVEFERGGAAPAGAKGDPVSMASLAITLAPAALTGLFSLVQVWLTRHDKSTVTIEMGADKIVLSGSPSKEQRDIIQSALQRHQQTQGWQTEAPKKS